MQILRKSLNFIVKSLHYIRTTPNASDMHQFHEIETFSREDAPAPPSEVGRPTAARERESVALEPCATTNTSRMMTERVNIAIG